jgi:hypothetical protein
MTSSRRGSVFLDIPFYRTGFAANWARFEVRVLGSGQRTSGPVSKKWARDGPFNWHRRGVESISASQPEKDLAI